MQKTSQGPDVTVTITEKLANLPPMSSKCCIFRVHSQLRKINKEAYEPELVSIGPYHRGKSNLQMIEEQKLRYLNLLLHRKNESVTKYVAAMKALEEEARSCYADPIPMNSAEFVEMMVLDGCFVVELIRKFDMLHLREKNDPIFKMDWIVSILQRDLMLFENQLPFLVLQILFDLIEVPNYDRFVYLVLRFFSDLFPGPGFRQANDGNALQRNKHLLGMIHNNWLPSSIGPHQGSSKKGCKENVWRFIPCAALLKEAGIKFEKSEEGSLFDVRFKRGKLKMPTLSIEDRTETFLRNLIAYEQYCEESFEMHFVTDYIKFMDCLINSAKDVEILSRCRIIENWMGDDEVISSMFNRINDSVIVSSDHFCYAEIVNQVNVYSNRSVNRWMAKLKRKYLNSPWAVISVIAALVLLLLTLTQTIFAGISLK